MVHWWWCTKASFRGRGQYIQTYPGHTNSVSPCFHHFQECTLKVSSRKRRLDKKSVRKQEKRIRMCLPACLLACLLAQATGPDDDWTWET